MSDKEKTDEKEGKKKVSLEQLAKDVDTLWSVVRALTKSAEKHFGADLDGDGKVGGARIGLLTSLGVVLVCAGIVSATQSFTSGDKTHWDVAKITSSGTLSTDGGIVASGASTFSNAVTIAGALTGAQVRATGLLLGNSTKAAVLGTSASTSPLLQWGSIASTNGTGAVVFATAYPNGQTPSVAFSVQGNLTNAFITAAASNYFYFSYVTATNDGTLRWQAVGNSP